MRNKFVVYIYIDIYIYIYIYKIGKICQNIKPPSPTHISSSAQLSTWGRLED